MHICQLRHIKLLCSIAALLPATVAAQPIQGLTPTPANYAIPAWATPLDIVGVTIGMHADQAIATLLKHNPRLKLQTQTFHLNLWPKPATAIVVAEDREPGNGPLHEEITLRLALPPHPSVVIEALRWNNFYGTKPATDAVLAQLKAKYSGVAQVGPSTLPYKQNFAAFYDNTGKPVAKPSTCYANVAPLSAEGRWSSIKRLNDIDLDFQRVNVSVPGALKLGEACGSVVSATLVTSVQNSGTAEQLGVRISNERYRALLWKGTVDHALSIDSKRQEKEIDAGKGRSVKM